MNAAFFTAAPMRSFRGTVQDALVQATTLARIDEPPPDENAGQCHLVRDVFGNPYRAVLLGTSSMTCDVGLLAQAAYDERFLPLGALDSARLAILADALEEAGCTNLDVLAHLRSPGPHVRGCWALDLILGKS
jgi:hypothetical protein